MLLLVGNGGDFCVYTFEGFAFYVFRVLEVLLVVGGERGVFFLPLTVYLLFDVVPAQIHDDAECVRDDVHLI